MEETSPMEDSTYAVDLCVKVLNYVAFSSPVTGDKTPDEIKFHLSKIFPEEVINSAAAILCGEQPFHAPPRGKD
jgi:hypothetical protein